MFFKDLRRCRAWQSCAGRLMRRQPIVSGMWRPINDRRKALGLRRMSATNLLGEFLAALNPIGRAEAIEGFCGIVHFWTWATVRAMEKVSGTGSTVSSDLALESANKNCY